ncbi:ABC transporter ATP-binding protein [Thermodesulfobacteriota bacterium]
MDSNNIDILEFKNVTKTFDGVKAVDSLNIGFRKGLVTGLIGPNGAGKTTIFNLISGLISPDKGEIVFKDARIDNATPWRIAQMGIGRHFQDIRVFGKLTVIENVLIAIPNQMGEKFYEGIFARKNLIKIEKENSLKAEELLSFVGLIEKKDTLAENLSYGQQKLLSIARLLAMNAELLLLDEPASGVHPSLIDSIIELLKSLTKKGKTIIFIEHNINTVLEIADWVYLLDDGKEIAFGLPDEVIHDKVTREIYLGV